jgi:predicted O-methyltransferase YrrM
MVAIETAQRLAGRITRAYDSLREEGPGFLLAWVAVRDSVAGWLTGPDARLLYALAQRGPGKGAIVEIGSAWGKSTIMLAKGSKSGRREKVYAIDPHTGDPWYLREQALTRFSSLETFTGNLRRHHVDDWVIPVVSTSLDAGETLETGPVRLLYVDGLHTYDGVRSDIQVWLPRVTSGGIVVFDDYFNGKPGVGVRQAVDELLASGAVDPVLRAGERLTWTTKR